MHRGATKHEVDHVVEKARALGLDVQMNYGTDLTVIAILGSGTGRLPIDTFGTLPGVESVTRIMKPYKLASKEFKVERTVVDVRGVQIGGPQIIIMAGPCAVESMEQLLETARIVKGMGATVLRGGAYKPRTSPFSFQGLEEAGLEILSQVSREVGIPIITEVLDTASVESVAKHADILQIGARNMQNFALLKEAGKSKHPVVLKRGLANTVTEWLTAADYLLAEGNEKVILCERGIRTFEDSMRFSLDVGSIGIVKKFSHLPIIVDPSHAAGHFDYVPTLAKAGLAAGADGMLIEVHPNPEEALVDGLQSLTPRNFELLMSDLRTLSQAVGRYI